MNRMKKVLAVTLSAATIGSVAVAGTGMSAGASGTGAGLAEYALNAYYEGWSYVWGGAEPGAVDCSGLIWSYCGGDRISMLSDAQANGRDWGYVSDGIPRVHGLGLSRPNHVGVYIEDGMEVDARGSDYGVCYQQIGENGYNNWDCWFKLTAVDYPTEGWENFNGNTMRTASTSLTPQEQSTVQLITLMQRVIPVRLLPVRVLLRAANPLPQAPRSPRRSGLPSGAKAQTMMKLLKSKHVLRNSAIITAPSTVTSVI